MKHKKKKTKSSPDPKIVGGGKGGGDEENEESRVLKSLIEAFGSASLEEAAAAYREAKGDPNKAAEILGGLTLIADDQTPSCSSSSGSAGLSSSSCFGSGSGSSSSEVFMDTNYENAIHGKGFRGSKQKKVIAATGTVSTVLGKNYVMSSPRRESVKSKGYINVPLCKGDAEQFLYAMLGDQCELSMAVVRDVLSHCGGDVEKALNALLELSDSSYEPSENGQSSDVSAFNTEDGPFLLECSDNLTDRSSDSTSHSSENDDNFWSLGDPCRNYSEVLAGSQVLRPTSYRGSKTELPHEVLESLFNMPKTSEREPSTMNWRNVVKKMESMGQRLEFCPSGTAEPHQNTFAKGDDYHAFREAAKQQWDSMKSYYQKAATAFSNGNREYAAYLSDQGRLCNKMAKEADEKASQQIFQARNKQIENLITIDLHGQHVKQAMRLLKLHLLFGAYVRSVQSFRVITGSGSHGVGKSKLKQSVIDIVEREGIQWSEENRGTLIIRLGGQRGFSFLDSESDSE